MTSAHASSFLVPQIDRARSAATWRGALLVGLLALTLRLVFLVASAGGGGQWNLETDSGLYVGLGQSLAAGHGFGVTGPDAQFHPEYLTLPPYPAFLALCMLVGSHWELVALLAQCLLSSAMAALVYVLARRMAGGVCAALAGVLASIDPQAITYSNLILTDIAGMAAMIVALAALQRLARRPTLGSAVLCGLALAVSAFIRPVGAYLWLIAAVVALLANGWTQLRHSILQILTLAVIAHVPVVAWSARNAAQAGSWFYSTTPDIVLVNWQLARLVMETDGVSQREARQMLAARLDVTDTWDVLSRRPDPAVRARAHALARELVLAHPLTFARLYLAGVVRVALQPDPNVSLVLGRPAPETGLAQGRLSLLAALRARWNDLDPLLRGLYFGQVPFMLLLWLLSAIGVVAGLLRHGTRPFTVGLALVVVYVMLTAGGYPGDPRYRLAALPALCVLAALGVDALTRRSAPES